MASVHRKQNQAGADKRGWLAWCMLTWCFGLVQACLAGTEAARHAPPDRGGFDFAEPYLESVATNTHIPYGLVTALVQDSRGLIWLGTQYGLLRYDGYRFRRFVYVVREPTSLPGNYVVALHAGANGRLWVATQNDGLVQFEPESERFVRVATRSTKTGEQMRINAMVDDGHHGVWIGTTQGVQHVAANGSVLAHWRHQPSGLYSLNHDRVDSLLHDRQGRLWVGTAGTLQRTRSDGRGLEQVPLGDDMAAGPNEIITTMIQARDGKIWLGTRRHGAAWLDPASLQVHWLAMAPNRLAALSHGWVSAIVQPNAGQIWLGTIGGGINLVAAEDGRILRHLRHEPGQTGSLALDEIGAFLLDNAGMLWVGTRGMGLQRYNSRNQAFRMLRHGKNLVYGLSHANVRSVLELADGKILVGTGGNGIDVLDRHQGLIGGYRVQNGGPHAPALPDGHVLALAQTADGVLWAGTQQAGVVRLAPGAAGWQSWPGLPAQSVRQLLVARDGRVWAGTRDGLAYCVNGGANFVAVPGPRGQPMQADILAIAEDAQGRIWAASDAGLWLVEPNQPHARVIHAEPDRPAGLVSDFVKGIVFDRQQRLWVSTGKGLERLLGWDGQRADFEHVSDRLGQSGTDAYGNLLVDGQGRIWGSRFVVDPQQMRVEELSRADGLDMGTVWIGAIGRTRDGLLLLGGTQGLAVIDPARYRGWDHQPPLVVTEVKINGKPVEPGSLASDRPRLQLAPVQRNLTLEFAALDYFAPQKNRYRYRLQNYEANWIESDAEHRIASYGNLWPGRYTLQVQGSNSAGDWSPKLLEIPIEIIPEFWQTPWFAALLLLVLAGSVLAALRLQRARLQARACALEATVAERTAEMACAHKELLAMHSELEQAHRQQQQSQQQLILQEKMAGLGTLTAGVAHEINNPTNFTHVAAQIQRERLAEFEQFVRQLLDEEAAPEIVQEFAARFAELQGNVDTMLNGTERIRAIVKDLRSFTRLDEADKKTVHLSECLAATVNLARTSWLEQVEFITEFVDDPPCECWPALLNQVFMNLLVNGCQAIAARRKQGGSTERGHLWLRLRQNGATLMVQIEDDGIGMSPELQQRILEPFFTTREVGSGSGMGLAISYGIIQKHGGTLDIASTPGQGSCFTLHLPLQG